MAAGNLVEPALLAIAREIPVEAIPEKLRCATCDKLAINAVKIPCCDSTICTYCHETLPDTECPICTHSPFTASLCLPAKALQSTVKAFVKTEAKKRATEVAVPAKEEANATQEAREDNSDVAGTVENPTLVEPSAVEDEPSAGSRQPDGQASGADADHPGTITNGNEQQNVPHNDDEADGEDDDDDEDIIITTERPEAEHQVGQSSAVDASGHANGQQSQDSANTGYEQNFSNMMTMNGMDPNQMAFMQQMMGMSGMGMGMGMGMDPSMMFGNFGGMGNMNDMSMMNMAMGMGGMNGMGDMANFGGMGGPGFFGQGNYMQSNFGNQRQQPFPNHHGQGRPYGRGFGRGRGQYARGRGGWGPQHPFGQQQPFQQGGFAQQSDVVDAQDTAPVRRGSPSYANTAGQDDRMASENGQHQDRDGEAVQNHTAGDSATAHFADAANDGAQGSGAQDATNEDFNGEGYPQQDAFVGMQNGSFGDYNNMQQNQYAYGNGGRGDFHGRGGFGRGRGGYGAQMRGQDATELTPKSAPPVNAPTGPKALRQGLPNTGWSGRMGVTANQRQTATSTPPAQPRDGAGTSDQRPDGRDISSSTRTNGEANGHDRHSPSRSRSRSRSRHQSTRARERAQSSANGSDGDYARRKERDRERRKRKDRERRHEDDSHARGTRDGDEIRKGRRSRSVSPDEDAPRQHRHEKMDDHRRPRPRRERSTDKHRRRHRSRSPDRDDDRSHRKGRSHRDDKVDDIRDKDGRNSRRHSRRDEEERTDDRKHRSHRSERDDDRDRDNRRSRGHRHESSRTVIEPPSDELGFKIKGSKSASTNGMGPPPSRDRRASHRDTTPAEPTSNDPYAEERARAQKNRVAAEAQRRQSSSLGKRGWDDEPMDAPTGPRGTSIPSSRSKKVKKDSRQISYKYEDEIGVDDRDSRRWR